MSYSPMWSGSFGREGADGPMLGRAVGIIKKFLPTLGARYEFEDLVQESWLVFEKCRRVYVEEGNDKWGKVSNGKWFGRLFETALQRKFITLCRNISSGLAYNLADAEEVSGSVGIESLMEILESLSPEARRILVDVVEKPESIEHLSRADRHLLVSQLSSNFKEIHMATAKAKKAPAKTPAAKKAPAKTQAAKKAPAKTPAAKNEKKTLEEILLEATGEEPRQEGEEVQDYIDRVAEKVSEMDNEVFDALPAAAHKWYESAQVASEKNENIPSFIGKEKKKPSPAASSEPKVRKERELDPNSMSHKAREFLLSNPKCTLKELSEALPKANKNSLFTIWATIRPFLRMLEERGVSL